MNNANFYYNGQYFYGQQPPPRIPGHWAAFLAGLRGDPPPPRPQEVAAAVALTLLNGAQPHHQLVPLPAPDAENRQENQPAPVRRRNEQVERPDPSIITCDIPLNTMDITKDIITVTESLSSTLEPIDFLERLCIRMGIEREGARLAYRWHNDPASTRRPLTSDSDVTQLFAENVKRKEKWRTGNKEVKICVDNLNKVPRTAAARKEAEKKRKRDEAAAAVKDSDESCAAEFGICREKLRCPHNQTSEAYCWTNPSDPQKRCQRLEPWEVQAWARLMKEGKCDKNCTLPPNSPLFDRLTAHQSGHTGKKTGSSAAAPSIIIHNHLGAALSDAHGAVNGASNVASSRALGATSDSAPSPATRKVRGVPLPISDALAALDKVYPDSRYSSYEEALKKEGFYYAENILHFASNTDIFTTKVGMPLGAVPMFLQLIEDEVEAHTSKRRRLDDHSDTSVDQENIAPTA